jgi:hypothetical protein
VSECQTPMIESDQTKGKNMSLSDLERVVLEATLSDPDRRANAESHHFDRIDDVMRCLNCEIGIWNAWKMECPS